MRLQVKALAAALAVVWGALVLLAGLAHLLWAGYGEAFWELVASLYPGVGVGIGSVVLGTLFALIDGGVCGAIIAWVYNATAGQASAA